MVSMMTSVEPITIPEGYKQTEVGVIPMEWDTKLLRNISPSISVGLVINPSSYFDEKGTVPMLVGSTVKENKILWEKANCISEASNKKIPASRLKAGDMVTVRVGEPGITAVIPPILDDCNCASMMIVRKSAAFDSVWLCFVMNSKIGITQIKDVQYGTAQKQFNISDALNFNYPFPPLKEQTAIANALSDVDNLITSLETLIAKKSAIKTAAMQQLLSGKKRLPGFEGKSVKESEKQGAKQSSELDNTSETAQAAQTKQTSTLNSDLYKEPSEGLDSKLNQLSEVSNANNKKTAPRPGYKQTELGEIPEDWEVKPINEIVIGTQLGGNYANTEVETAYPLIKMGNLGRGKINLSKLEYVQGEVDSRDLLKQGDVLFNTRNTLTLVGKVSIWRNELPQAYFNSNILRFKFDEALVSSSEYINAAMNTKKFVSDLAGIATGTTSVAAIYTRDLLQLNIILPSRQEQTAIANVLSDMDTELDALQQRLSKTQKIKQGMMQELLTGKTRLV